MVLGNGKELNEIWADGKGRYKAYSTDLKLLTKLARWKKVEVDAIYMTPQGKVFAKVIVFPSSIYDRIAKELKLPQKAKSPGRVKQGHRLAEARSIEQVKSSKKTR